MLAPLTGWAIYLLVEYLSDPGCNSCGNDDTWTTIAITFVIFVAPGAASVGLGVLARHGMIKWTRLREKRRSAATD